MRVRKFLAGIAAVATVVAGSFFAAGGTADAAPQCGIYYGVAGYPDWEGLSLPGNYVRIQHVGGIFGVEPWANWRAYDDTVNATAGVLVDHLNWASTHVRGDICAAGHSLGAAIVTEAAIRVNNLGYANRVHVLTTGNPKNPGGIEDTFNGVWIGPGIHFTGPYRPWQVSRLASFTSVCNPNDVICRAPNPVVDAAGFFNNLFGGYLFGNAHTSYGWPW